MVIKVSRRRGTKADFEGSEDLGRWSRARVFQVGTPWSEAQKWERTLIWCQWDTRTSCQGALNVWARLREIMDGYTAIFQSELVFLMFIFHVPRLVPDNSQVLNKRTLSAWIGFWILPGLLWYFCTSDVWEMRERLYKFRGACLPWVEWCSIWSFARDTLTPSISCWSEKLSHISCFQVQVRLLLVSSLRHCWNFAENLAACS